MHTKSKKIVLLFILISAFTIAKAQVEERERPAEWQNLINGGRFMDRFLPMEGKILTSDTWGAECVRPRYIDNGIEDRTTSYWGGNILQTPDGKYHMFVCGWPENSPKGHMTWHRSVVYHAIGEKLNGPYTVKDTIGDGHNPEAFVLKDGRIVLYVINGRYIAHSVDGPWEYGKFDFDPRGRKILSGLSNLTFARRQDGSYLMICRGGGVWISRDGLSTYKQITDGRVYPPVRGRYEDPLIWRDSIQYHMIVNDWLGRIAYYQRSKDGINWITEPGEAYLPGVSRHKDGLVEDWFKYERIKVFQDEYGRAVQMNFAVIDTLKKEDKPYDNHSSKNICLPVNKGLLLSVLNQEPITASTPAIEVKVRAEKGFDPHKDINIQSLRFGSYQEVNYGRGSKVVSTKKSGKDLIVIFNGTGSGITEDEFAPKLIGKDKKGNLLFGYASLPYVDYTPPILSNRVPVYDSESKQLKMEVENFGLSESKAVIVELSNNGKLIGRKEMKTLKPYETTTLLFDVESGFSDENAKYKVVFIQK